MNVKQHYITVVAIFLVVATTGALWNIGAYRVSLERPAADSAPGGTSVPMGPVTATPSGSTPTTSAPTNATTQPAAKVAEPATSATPTATATPATATPAPDYDGDGIPDGPDRCPTRPETFNGYKDGDGCPDVVATSGAS